MAATKKVNILLALKDQFTKPLKNTTAEVKKQQKQSRETTKQRQAARIRNEQAEREVARLEEEVEFCDAKLSDASLSPEELIAESSRYAELEEQLARAMEEWEAAAEAYEALKN